MSQSVFTSAYKEICGRLEAARKANGKSQAALAKALGRPQSFVSKYERRERRLDVVEFIAVSIALGLDPCGVIREIMKRNHRDQPLTKKGRN